MIAVNTRWIYNDNKNSNTKSLPDSIQMDIDLETGKITLNLTRHETNSPLIMTQLEGQREFWKPPEDEVNTPDFHV